MARVSFDHWTAARLAHVADRQQAELGLVSLPRE